MDRQRSFESEHPRAIHPEALRLRSRRGARACPRGNRARGFTVVEVFIVVATVSTLTAIAVPSYVYQLRKSARIEAQSFLVSVAAKEQQHLLERGRYAATLHSLAVQPPAGLSGKYTFAVKTTGGAQPTFTLSALAAGEQAKDTCPSLTIHSSGAKLPDACW
jgi:type IV pilus assembly protein PilE